MKRFAALLILFNMVFVSVPAIAFAESPKEVRLIAQVEFLERLISDLEAQLEGLKAELDVIRAAGTEAAAASDTWERLNSNWYYKNATTQKLGMGMFNFVVEMKRMSKEISTAMFTVTVYDDEGAVVGVGQGVLNNVVRGEVRTVEFLVHGQHEQIRSYRLQVDYEF